ncbi:MAG: trypsin-like serine protease [Phycisphaerae bacterium]|jgi:hypothetical protein
MRLVTLRWTLALTILATSASAVAIIRRHDREDGKYLELGSKYPAVVRLGGGTATLVDPCWLLTAGHVTAGLSPFDRFVEIGGKRYAIEGVVRHPKWLARSGPKSVDIGLVKLTTAVAGVEPVALYEQDDEAGKPVVFVGPGEYGDGLSGPVGDDGRWRGATNTVASVLDNWITFKFDSPPNGSELEGISGPGDSGGPALLEADGRTHVIGVSSANDDAGAAGPCRYESTEYYARVSAVAAWIRDTIRDGVATREPARATGNVRSGKWPANAAGRVAEAFFAAYARGDDETMAAFERECRAESALRSRPVEERVESWRRLHQDWGKLEPTEYVETADGRLHVLVHAEREGVWKSFRFDLEASPPQKLIGIGISSPTLIGE